MYANYQNIALSALSAYFVVRKNVNHKEHKGQHEGTQRRKKRHLL
jgi:hypothetical protein